MIRWLLVFLRALQRFGFLSLMFLGCADDQLSSSAYRVLGQPDLRQRGINILQNGSMNGPAAIALDRRAFQTHFYVADTAMLAFWLGTTYTGDPPTLILGQQGPQYSTPLGA